MKYAIVIEIEMEEDADSTSIQIERMANRLLSKEFDVTFIEASEGTLEEAFGL